jgi:uncharacterized cofD-like protein
MTAMPAFKFKVVVMGGGTGIFPVISALKQLDVDIYSVVAVSDSGGSTGRIRDEFGFQPVGDLRQSLAALAENEAENWIQKILLYRFEKGEGLKGHNLGNLLLTALQDMTGDTTKALEIAEKVFRLNGSVVPVTQERVDLKINYVDGTSDVGEHILDEQRQNPQDQPKKIKDIELKPPAPLNEVAREAMETADLIIIGPGDYYASLMAVLAPDGIVQAFQRTQAKVMYILNLMTRLTQTPDMTAQEHIEGIEKAIGRRVDLVLANNQPIPEETLKLYAAENEFPVVDDLGDDPRIIRKAIVSDSVIKRQAYDVAHRSLLRHDSQKIKDVLEPILES